MWIYVSGSRDYKILSSESRVWENQSRIASPVHNEQSSSTGRVSAVLNVAVVHSGGASQVSRPAPVYARAAAPYLQLDDVSDTLQSDQPNDATV